MRRYLITLALIPVLLAGCGTKGPLFLPAPTAAVAPGTTTETLVSVDHSSAGRLTSGHPA